MQHSKKQLHHFRQGRIRASKEVRRQLVLRNNLEKTFFTKLRRLFNKFSRVQMHLFKEYGIYQPQIASRNLNEDLFPLMQDHIRRTFVAIYKNNEERYNKTFKAEEVLVFGKSVDIELLISQYFATRQLFLSGISQRLANQISKTIEEGRSENLNLQQIAKNVVDKFKTISMARSALISRTETHNAASFANHSYHDTLRNDLGIKVVKRWAAVNDARTRSAHAEASGQIVDMDDDFTVGGVPMSYAGDSRGGAKNVINCRCVIIYADEQDLIQD